MNIQCIALDLDRTTLNSQGRLSAGNRQAIEAAIAQGIHVVIASGRALASLPMFYPSPVSNTPSHPTVPPSAICPPDSASAA